MSRPLSVAGSLSFLPAPGAANTTTTITTPSPSLPPLRSSLADLLITNLRLLDLDTRPDWPDVTPKTFAVKDSQANQKQRIRCVEWCLFSLFAIWDPDEARDKLQPFFPPLEPLQSLNLRAALFRSLNELKKANILGREIVLRKTMLDECKGDKLLEVLVVFSTAVVRKVVVEPRLGAKAARQAATPSLRLATNPLIDAASQGSLLPLSLAHRVGLTRLLEQKQEKRSRFERFNGLLQQKREELRDRYNTCRTATDPTVAPHEQDSALRQIKANWPGNSAWPEALVNGDAERSGDHLLKRPFEHVWGSVVDGRPFKPQIGSVGLLASLEERVNVQSRRLKKWQSYQSRVSSLMGVSTEAMLRIEKPPSRERPAFRFDKHAGSHLSRNGAPREQRSNSVVDDDVMNMDEFSAIVAAMKNDLVTLSRPKRREETVSAPKTVDKALKPLRLGQSFTKTDRVPPSSAPIRPIRPSYEQKRTVSGGLNSPPTRFPVSARFSPSTIFSPARVLPTDDADATADISLSDVLGLDKLRSTERTPPSRSSSAMGDLQHQQSAFTGFQPAISSGLATPPASGEEFTASTNTSEPDEADRIVASVLNASPSPAKRAPPLSLAERTRLSMAHTYNHNPPPRHEVSNLAHSPAPASPPISSPDDIPHEESQPITLTERTRLSIAAFAQPGDRPISLKEGRRHTRRPSARQSLFPVNQFETPGRPRPSAEELLFSSALAGTGVGVGVGARGPFVQRRDGTPTEKLFADGVDADSVFRSRPRVKMSPVYSPEGRGADYDGDRGEGDERWEGGEGGIAGGDSSPTGGRGRY